MMVMTILEGHVARENWPALERAYKEAAEFAEPGLVRSYLIHAIKDSEAWRILTIWSSREALDEMRKSKETPRGVLIFRQAGAEPSLTIYDIDQQIDAKEIQAG